jgi:hypothetical protein
MNFLIFLQSILIQPLDLHAIVIQLRFLGIMAENYGE